jgi:hypothetical protein
MTTLPLGNMPVQSDLNGREGMDGADKRPL